MSYFEENSCLLSLIKEYIICRTTELSHTWPKFFVGLTSCRTAPLSDQWTDSEFSDWFTLFVGLLHCRTIALSDYWALGQVSRMTRQSPRPNLTESRLEKKYFVLVEGFQAVFSYMSRSSKSILPLKGHIINFLLVLDISKAVKHPYLPFSYE